jgi:hypothetical protein
MRQNVPPAWRNRAGNGLHSLSYLLGSYRNFTGETEKGKSAKITDARLGRRPPFPGGFPGNRGGWFTDATANADGGRDSGTPESCAGRPRYRAGSGKVDRSLKERPAIRRCDGSDHSEAARSSDWGRRLGLGDCSAPHRQAPEPRNQMNQLEEYLNIVSRC